MELQNLPWYGQLLVFLLIGAVLFAIFYFVVYSPTQDEIASIVAQSEQLQEEIRRAERNQDKLMRLEEEKALNEKILEDLKGILPEKKEVSQILRKIQAIASNARLKTGSLVFNREQSREIYLEWPITISIEGNYHNLGIFFDQVSRMKKIFNIDSLHIAPLASANYDYTITANFIATTYIYQERPKPKAPPRAAPRPREAADPDAGLRGGDF